MNARLTLTAVVSVIVIALGCSDDDSNPVDDPNNQSPVIDSIIALPDTFTANTSATLIADASDPDGHTLSYAWESRDSWLAPVGGGGASIQVSNCCEITEIKSTWVVLTVTDGHGGQAVDSCPVAVRPEG